MVCLPPLPRRPSSNQQACNDTRWFDGTNCQNGFNFVLQFDLTDQGTLSLPLKVVPAVAFNTRGYGDTPIGATGPYDSLNVALPYLYQMDPPPVQIGITGNCMWDSTYNGRPRGLTEDDASMMIMRIE